MADKMSESASASRRVGELSRHLSSSTSSSSSSSSSSTSTSSSSDTSAFFGDCSNATIEAMKVERARATFSSQEMKHFLNGGTRITAIKDRIYDQLEKSAKVEPSIANDKDYEGGTTAARPRTVQRIRAFYRMFMADQGDPDARQARIDISSIYDPAWATRNGIHFGLFAGAIQSQGNDEQVQEWVPRLFSLSMYGCFGMTELGHGSFVRGIETTATFVPSAGEDGDGEWEIHTPTITATKWWIGGLGETSTHMALYARLITKGVDCGVHVFLVQLRDMETHTPLPNLRMGDIGPKFGRNGIDNGWLQFHHARYPRSALLARYASVTKEGAYVKAPAAKPQLAYGALVMGRATMVSDSAMALQLATTIAVRWAAMRRQGAPFTEGSTTSTTTTTSSSSSSSSAIEGVEPQVIDYATQQSRLMPLLATAVGFVFTASRMREMYDALVAGLDNEDTSALPDVHATSSGLKAFCTWATHLGIDTCRQCMGGHGYSSYSRLPSLFADFAVMCTWEGDNTVMALQTSRYLISSLNKAKAGQQLAGSVTYLTDKNMSSKCPANNAEDMLDPTIYIAAMRWRARSAVLSCATQLEHTKKTKKDAHSGKPLSDGEVWNANSVALVGAARAHVYYNIAASFAFATCRRREEEERVLKVKYADVKYKDPNSSSSSSTASSSRPAAAPVEGGIPVTSKLYPSLKAMCDLFAMHSIQADLAGYLRGGYFTPAQANLVDAHVTSLCSRVREDAVAIVDSFGISDFVVNSPLGRADGDVYRHYMATVQAHGAGYGGPASIAASAGTVTAATGPPALIGAGGGAGNSKGSRVPIPLQHNATPYFEELLKPMLEGADHVAGPLVIPGADE